MLINLAWLFGCIEESTRAGDGPGPLGPKVVGPIGGSWRGVPRCSATCSSAGSCIGPRAPPQPAWKAHTHASTQNAVLLCSYSANATRNRRVLFFLKKKRKKSRNRRRCSSTLRSIVYSYLPLVWYVVLYFIVEGNTTCGICNMLPNDNGSLWTVWHVCWPFVLLHYTRNRKMSYLFGWTAV